MSSLAEEWIEDVIANSIAIGRRVRDGSRWAASVKRAERLEELQMQISLLKEITGQDFGDDIEAYDKWYAEHKHDWFNYSRIKAPPGGWRI